MHLPPPTKRGFTLIELSIVLVIIGLIVGGVLVGQDLIKAAAMRKTITELEKIQTAMATFRGKYNCIAGDCANATAFFGTDGSGCPNNLNSGGNNTGVCNGDGNGTVVGWSNGSTVNVENVYLWEELSMANMVPSIAVGPVVMPGDSYDSIKGGPNWIGRVIGYNVPASAISTAIGYNMYTSDPTLSYWGDYPSGLQPGMLMVEIGGSPVGGGETLYGAGLTSPQAQQLDTKIDDGHPNTGRVSSQNALAAGTGNPNTTCLSGSSYSNSLNTGCNVFFLLKL